MSLQSNALRTTGGEALKTIFLLQIGVGSCASVLLFSHNVPPILHGHEQRLFNRIPTHMALVLLSTGIPLPMAAFVFRHPLSTLGCTRVHYTHQMTCSTTLCSTGVLSTFRCVILFPGQRGGCSEDEPPRSLVLPVHLLDLQCLN